MRSERILIDARARQSGTAGSFVLALKPTFENIRRVRLVYADLPNPASAPSGPYFNVRIAELGTGTRLAGTSRETSFIVPVNANVGERCYYNEKSAFSQTMEFSPGLSLQSLSVTITRNYGAAQLDRDDSTLILEVEHE